MTTQAVPRRRLGQTTRRDRWWVPAAATAFGLSAFGIYSIFAVLVNRNYLYLEDGAHYLSPFYSPDLRAWGLDIGFSYAPFVVWIPLGFRLTCYYYRKAYYRAFLLAPPACGVGGAPKRYRGEARMPFILQNVHRYFLLLATIILGVLWYDAIRAFLFRTDDGSLEFGIGLGSLVMLVNVLALTAFTFGCNSARHLVGGQLNCFTCSAMARTRHKAWKRLSLLNGRHMQWAWISLFIVGLTDLYIRLAAGGVFNDPRIL